MSQISPTAQGYQQILADKIASRTAVVSVIGLGYVGLPLAVEFAKAGFNVVALDLDGRKIDDINAGHSYIKDVAESDVAEMVKAGRLRATSDYGALLEVDTISICVPTPLRKTKDPDISFIVSATEFYRGKLPSRPTHCARKHFISGYYRRGYFTTALCRGLPRR